MGIAAQIETNGIPINNNLYDDLEEHYPCREQEMKELEAIFDVYELENLTWKFEKELELVYIMLA